MQRKRQQNNLEKTTLMNPITAAGASGKSASGQPPARNRDSEQLETPVNLKPRSTGKSWETFKQAFKPLKPNHARRTTEVSLYFLISNDIQICRCLVPLLINYHDTRVIKARTRPLFSLLLVLLPLAVVSAWRILVGQRSVSISSSLMTFCRWLVTSLVPLLINYHDRTRPLLSLQDV